MNDLDKDILKELKEIKTLQMGELQVLRELLIEIRRQNG